MRYLLRYINFLFLIALLLQFSGCQSDELSDPVPDVSETVRIELFTRAYGYNIPVTRALADENAVDHEPYILVFAKNNSQYDFVEAVKAFTINNQTKTYVILQKQDVECKLLILANPQDNFYVDNLPPYPFNAANLSTALTNKTLEEACDLLLTEPLINSQAIIPFTPGKKIPMSIVYTLPTGINNTTTIGTTTNVLELTRSVAKVVLKNTATSTFTLSGILEVNNLPHQGQIHNLSDPPIPMTITPSDLISYRKADGTNIINAVNNSTEDEPLYIFESHVDNESYMIIKGSYRGLDCYYKLVFVDTNRNYVHLLRNHQYIYTITKVFGEGHPTPQEARDAPAYNNNLVHLELKVVDPSAYETIAFDDYYMSVSNSQYIAYSNSADDELVAFTLVTEKKQPGTINGTIKVPDGVTLVSPASATFTATNTLFSQEVKIKIDPSSFTTSDMKQIELKLGNIQRRLITVERRDLVPKAGTGSKPIYYYYYNYDSGNIYNNWYGYDHNRYLLSGYLEDTSNKNWLQLSPENPNLPSSLNEGRNDDLLPGTPRPGFEDAIMVDNGRIQIHVLQNNTNTIKNGTVFLTTIRNPGYDPGTQNSFRIKIDISQSGD